MNNLKNKNYKMKDNDEEMSNSIMAIRYKIVFVGDICVGKTSIMNRFISDEFQEEYDVNKYNY